MTRLRMRHRSSHSARQEDEFRRDGDGWQGRPLGAGAGDRALTESERMRALRLSRHLYKRGGMYASMVDRLVDFSVGDGVVLEVEDDEVRAYLEAVLPGCTEEPEPGGSQWWRDLKRRWRETLNEGEYLLSIETGHRNPGEEGAPIPTGAVRFGRIEVERIRDAHVSARDQDELVALSIATGTGDAVTYPVARRGVAPVPELVAVEGRTVRTGRLVAVHYWRTNQLGPRGAPHLLRLLGKTGLVDDVVDQSARKGEILNRVVMHGEYQADSSEGAPDTDPQAVADKAFEDELMEVLTNPSEPTAFVSSVARKVTIKAVAPDLKILDQRALYDLVVDYICGSASFPKHWFGGGGDTVRAVAMEQGSPAHRMLVGLQADLQMTLEDLVGYLVWLGKRSGRIRPDRSEQVSVLMALIATRDSQRDAGVLQQVSANVAFLEDLGHISPAEAQRINRTLLKGQTFLEVKLDEKPPPVRPRGLGPVLGEMPEVVRESIRRRLPLHRRDGA